MALNIKNPEVERLATEVAGLAKESKTEAIRQALSERKARLELSQCAGNKRARLGRLLENQIWPKVPKDQLGKAISKREREKILGYGRGGV